MVEYTYKVTKESLIKDFEKARLWNKRNEEEGLFSFGETNLKLEIQDDFLIANGSHGYALVGYEEFTEEILFSILEVNEEAITPNLVKKVIELFIAKVDQAKD